MLTHVDKTYDIRVDGEGCEVTFLIVGGGGRAGQGGGGAGSGHIQYGSLQVSSGTVMTARVGRGGVHEYPGAPAQSSSVTFSDNGDTITAQPGQDGICCLGSGGDGYSGGGTCGYDYGGDGGSDGSDGKNGSYNNTSGGKGTGEDISHYSFSTWTLAPGPEGAAYFYCPSCPIQVPRAYYGGGGGGVLINRAGPEASRYQGQGYGGGGSGWRVSYGDVNYGDGLPGVILLEIN